MQLSFDSLVRADEPPRSLALIERFLEECCRTENTALCYRRVLHTLEARIGRSRPGTFHLSVDRTLLEDHISELRRHLAPSSVRQHVIAIRKFYGWLVAKKLRRANPARYLRAGPAPENTPADDTLPYSVVAQLLQGTGTGFVSRQQLMTAVIVYTFSSASTVCRIRCQDISLPRGSLSLTNRNERVQVPLVAELELLLSRYISQHRLENSSESLFTRRGEEDASSPLTRFAITQSLNRYGRSLGFEEAINPRCLRATAIQRYLELGGSSDVVARLTGISKDASELYIRSSVAVSKVELSRIVFS